MRTYKYPDRRDWPAIVKRPRFNADLLNATVKAILDDVRENGDEAVRRYEKKFDKAELETLAVTREETDEAMTLVDKSLLNALKQAHHNIYAFHAAQKMDPVEVETQKGVTCWQRSVAIEKVGLYVPGGTAPLFSTVLMLATPAKIAGCKDIVLCTPPDASGKVNPAILAAADIAGVGKIIKAGGVQAIAAMAYGTETVPKVYKIFGPGNQYVMAAKQLVSLGDVAIDMPAGPSEVCVIADEESDAELVAADLLSQAEHGADSQAMLITTSADILTKVEMEVSIQLQALPRKALAEKALENSKLILVKDKLEAMELSNLYAPEHLIISTSDGEALAAKVINAGSVFLGKYSCESAGDYASGTNHTLPTSGYATAYSGVNLDSFNKKITYQRITAEGIAAIGNTVEVMAEHEGLFAHKNAMTLRMKKKD